MKEKKSQKDLCYQYDEKYTIFSIKNKKNLPSWLRVAFLQKGKALPPRDVYPGFNTKPYDREAPVLQLFFK